MLTPEQSRAARGLLDWSQAELAKRSNLSESTIRDFEKGRRIPTPNNLTAIIEALQTHGVSLVNDAQESENGGPGVRFSRSSKLGTLKRRLSETEAELHIYQSQLDSFHVMAHNSPKFASDTMFIEHKNSLEREIYNTKVAIKNIVAAIEREEGQSEK